MYEVGIHRAFQCALHTHDAMFLGALQRRAVAIHDGALLHATPFVLPGQPVGLHPTDIFHAAKAPASEQLPSLFQVRLSTPKEAEGLRVRYFADFQLPKLICRPCCQVFVRHIHAHIARLVLLPGWVNKDRIKFDSQGCQVKLAEVALQRHAGGRPLRKDVLLEFDEPFNLRIFGVTALVVKVTDKILRPLASVDECLAVVVPHEELFAYLHADSIVSHVAPRRRQRVHVHAIWHWWTPRHSMRHVAERAIVSRRRRWRVAAL
mmetsp:Transcript_46416/g.92100  ORF Transcript_46416/g.92100 Transcript_46416/m.92100 type:complete len:263 (-) Transcript_46416:323-1111(-)